jgi:hypothetical protein
MGLHGITVEEEGIMALIQVCIFLNSKLQDLSKKNISIL